MLGAFCVVCHFLLYLQSFELIEVRITKIGDCSDETEQILQNYIEISHESDTKIIENEYTIPNGNSPI